MILYVSLLSILLPIEISSWIQRPGPGPGPRPLPRPGPGLGPGPYKPYKPCWTYNIKPYTTLSNPINPISAFGGHPGDRTRARTRIQPRLPDTPRRWVATICLCISYLAVCLPVNRVDRVNKVLYRFLQVFLIGFYGFIWVLIGLLRVYYGSKNLPGCLPVARPGWLVVMQYVGF